jgi:hypothetical protein
MNVKLRKAIGHVAEQPFTKLNEFHLPLSCNAQLVSREFEILKENVLVDKKGTEVREFFTGGKP